MSYGNLRFQIKSLAELPRVSLSYSLPSISLLACSLESLCIDDQGASFMPTVCLLNFCPQFARGTVWEKNKDVAPFLFTTAGIMAGWQLVEWHAHMED